MFKLSSLLLLAIGLPAWLTWSDSSSDVSDVVPGGIPARGRELVQQRGCVSCHIIPGLHQEGLVGPPLNRIGSRIYIAGVLPNTPENMLRWLADPPAVDKLTAMPNLHLSETDRRDLAAFLYELR